MRCHAPRLGAHALRSLCALGVAVVACGAPAKPPATAGAAQGHYAVLSPSAAEVLAALDVADRVVAVGDWVTWPPELARLPKLGAYDAPSEESLVALGVDTLITTSSVAGREGRERLARLGIRVVEVDTSTLDGSLAAIGAIGRLAGRAEAAARIEAQIRAGLEGVARRVAGVERRTTLVVVGREPLFVAGPGSYLDELVAVAGGSNVAADVGSSFAQVSLEAMLARRPQVVIDLSDNRPAAPRGPGPGTWGEWPLLPAVVEHRVWFVDPSRLSIPGPRLAEMAAELGRLIHPEIFGAPRPEDFSALGGVGSG